MGESANSPVHWIRGEDDVVFILIGEDQYVWDIGLTVNNEFLCKITSDIDKLINKL